VRWGLFEVGVGVGWGEVKGAVRRRRRMFEVGLEVVVVVAVRRQLEVRVRWWARGKVHKLGFQLERRPKVEKEGK
jgi:hypothetical protein